MDNGSRLTTIFGILVSIILLCSGSAYIGYTYGHNEGYYAGSQAGQSEYYEQERDGVDESSYQTGYNKGYESGLREAGSGYNLRNPTYQEMQEFLAHDTADSKSYVADKHICTDFSAEVNNNAEAKGIRCAVVYILYPEGGHTIVAFETIDKGLIFIEPQFDDEVKLTLGKSYSESNNYTPQSIDDTIQRFLITW